VLSTAVDNQCVCLSRHDVLIMIVVLVSRVQTSLKNFGLGLGLKDCGLGLGLGGSGLVNITAYFNDLNISY